MVANVLHAVDLTTPVKFGLKGSKLTADVTDFPVLLVLNRQRAANLAILQPLQVRIRDDAGTELPYQIERWNPDGNTVIWVKTTVRAGTDDQFLTLDGLGTTPTATAAALIGQSVWSNNFQAVLHLDGSKTDATGRWNLDTNSGCSIVDGPCGPATDFGGKTGMVTTNCTVDYPAQTWSFWVSYRGGSLGRVWHKYLPGSPSSDNFVWIRGNAGAKNCDIHFQDSVGGCDVSPTVNAWDTLKQVTIVSDTSDPLAKPLFYINGERSETYGGYTWAPRSSTRGTYYIGNRSDLTRSLNGVMDEFRLSSGVRSAAWIKADYLSQSDTLVDYAGKALSLPETITTRTSPAWVQGKLDDEATDLAATINTVQTPAWLLGGSQIAFGAQTQNQTLGITLRPGANTLKAQAKLKDGTPVAAESTINWIPTVLGSVETPSEIILRKGESLRLDLNAPADTPVAYDLNGDLLQDATGTASTPILATFNTVGSFTISAGTDRNGDGNIDLYSESQGSITVHVISADLPLLPCEIDFTRDLTVAINAPTAVKNQIILQSSSNIGAFISGVTSTTTGLNAKLTARNFGKTSVVTRLGVDGPVLGYGQVQAFTLRTNAETRVRLVQKFPDGSYMVEAKLILTPFVQNLDVLLHIFVGGVTFDDSTIDWYKSTNNFTIAADGTATQVYRMIKALGVKTGACHTIQVKYQGILVGGK